MPPVAIGWTNKQFAALDIYLKVQSEKGLAASTGNVWALLNAFCHTDRHLTVNTDKERADAEAALVTIFNL